MGSGLRERGETGSWSKDGARGASCVALLVLLCAIASGAHADGETVCHDGNGYRVVAKRVEPLGSDFLIRKTDYDAGTLPCVYEVKPGDFEIRNEQAEYFLALLDSHLILDSGTAPEPRGLIVWDLDTRRKVYSGSYSPPYSIDRDGIRFWVGSGAASDANCPQAAGWREQGLGAALEAEVRLDFSDYQVVRGTGTRCSARQ